MVDGRRTLRPCKSATSRRDLLRLGLATIVSFAARPGRSQDTGPMKLFVRVIGPRDGLADVGGPVEAWIEPEVKAKGTEHPRALSPWVEVGPTPRAIHASEMGGREIFAQRIEVPTADGITLRITGHKIAPARQDVALSLRPGTRIVVAVTRAADGRAMAIAAEIR